MVTAWQMRPREPMCHVVFFDALRVKIRDEAVIRSKGGLSGACVSENGTRGVLVT